MKNIVLIGALFLISLSIKAAQEGLAGKDENPCQNPISPFSVTYGSIACPGLIVLSPDGEQIARENPKLFLDAKHMLEGIARASGMSSLTDSPKNTPHITEGQREVINRFPNLKNLLAKWEDSHPFASCQRKSQNLIQCPEGEYVLKQKKSQDQGDGRLPSSTKR